MSVFVLIDASSYLLAAPLSSCCCLFESSRRLAGSLRLRSSCFSQHLIITLCSVQVAGAATPSCWSEMATAAVVSVTMGVMKPVLAKFTALMGDEYKKIKGLRKKVTFLQRELKDMDALLEKMNNTDELDPQAN